MLVKALCLQAVRPFTAFVRFVLLSIRLGTSCYHDLMNGLSNFDATYREYSLASTDTDDLISFPRSKVKVTAGHRGQNL